MPRRTKRSRAQAENAAVARAKTAENPYRRPVGSGRLGFLPEWYGSLDEMNNPIPSSSSQLIDDSDGSGDEVWDEHNTANLEEVWSDFSEEEFPDVESKSASYHSINERNQRQRRRAFKHRVRSSIIALINSSSPAIDPSLARKLFFRVIWDEFAEELNSFQPLNGVENEYMNRICEEFKAQKPGTAARVQIASKIFDDLGELRMFKKKIDARRALQCCRSTFDAAKKHAIIFGPGCPKPRNISKRSSSVKGLVQELQHWAEANMTLRISSYQTTREGEAISYLLSSINELWNLYSSTTQSRVGRTLFFRFFSQPKFQKMNLLGGLCSVCDSTGYQVRSNILELVEEFCPESLTKVTNTVDLWIRHVRLKMFPSEDHIGCLSHCYRHAMGHSCDKEHPETCQECMSIFETIWMIRPLVQERIQNKNDLFWTMQEDLESLARGFVGHRFRTASTKQAYAKAIHEIKDNHAVIILDFKQKLLSEEARESQSHFFGKAAFASLHGAAILMKQNDAHREAVISTQQEASNRVKYHYSRRPTVGIQTRIQTELMVQFIDLYSADTQQDATWVINAIEIVCQHLKESHPNIGSAEIWSDNAACYHNFELGRIAPLLFIQVGIQLSSMRFYEAGEGKSLLDRHFAVIRHAITRHVTSGLKFQALGDIERVLSGLSGVHAYEIQPNRSFENQGPTKKIKGISKLHDWRYEYLTSGIRVKMYREVWGSIVEEEPDHQEMIEFPADRVTRINCKYEHRSSSDRVLEPIFEPPNFLVQAEMLKSMIAITDDSKSIFVEGWGRHQNTWKKTGRFPAIIVRFLQYSYHSGHEQDTRNLNPKVVCQQLAQLIREGKINERALTEQQVKSWLSAEKRRNNPKPAWYQAGNPTCVWNPIETSEVEEIPVDPVESEREPRLALRFPTTLWHRFFSLQSSPI